MKLRNILLSLALVLGLGVCAVTVAQNVSPDRHPNLAAAQDMIDRAVGRLDAAQQANHWDMDGHAAHAKQLLIEARQEIALAARASNHNRH